MPTSFWVFLKCVNLHVPTYFCEFLYAKGMLKQKHVNAIFFYLFFMPPRYGVHGALKNAKAENIFMIFFQCRYREINMLKYAVQNIKINTELPLGESLEYLLPWRRCIGH